MNEVHSRQGCEVTSPLKKDVHVSAGACLHTCTCAVYRNQDVTSAGSQGRGLQGKRALRLRDKRKKNIIDPSGLSETGSPLHSRAR